jgi:hypothetical protein
VCPGERHHSAHRLGDWMGHRVGQDVLGKRKMCCSYQNRTPDLSAQRINIVFLFIIIVIADFMLTDLECEILNINDERYTRHEAKQSVLNLEITG